MLCVGVGVNMCGFMFQVFEWQVRDTGWIINDDGVVHIWWKMKINFETFQYADYFRIVLRIECCGPERDAAEEMV